MKSMQEFEKKKNLSVEKKEYPQGIFTDIVQDTCLSSRLDSILKTLQTVQKGINELKGIDEESEKTEFYEIEEKDDENVQKAKNVFKKMSFQKGRFIWVPSDYYFRSIYERKKLLNAPSIDHLCKTIILENFGCDKTDCSVRTYSKYYAFITQYTSKIDTEKVKQYFYKLNEKKIPMKKFSFRLANDSKSVTGYCHNSTPPVLDGEMKIPVVVSKSIMDLNPKIFFLGGGHIDLKVELDINEYIEKTNPFVFNCTNKLTKEEIDNLQEHEKEKVEKKEEKDADEERFKIDDSMLAATKDEIEDNPHLFDIRVGIIVEIGNHPKGDRLFVEKIKIGDGEPVQICSGLRGRIPIEELQNKKVLVVCNMKQAKLLGVKSHGMILCAVDEEDNVYMPEISEKAEVGERVSYIGVKHVEPVKNLNKKKIKTMLPCFKTNANKQACYKNYVMTTSGGCILGGKPNIIIR